MISSCVRTEYPLLIPEQRKMNNRLAVIFASKLRICILSFGCMAQNWQRNTASAHLTASSYASNRSNYLLIVKHGLTPGRIICHVFLLLLFWYFLPSRHSQATPAKN